MPVFCLGHDFRTKLKYIHVFIYNHIHVPVSLKTYLKELLRRKSIVDIQCSRLIDFSILLFYLLMSSYFSLIGRIILKYSDVEL